MVSIDDPSEGVDGRWVLGDWEADLIIGACGQSAFVTLVERTTRFSMLLALPEARGSDSVVDTAIDNVTDLPEAMTGSITWDQGNETAEYAKLTAATTMPVYFAPPDLLETRPEREHQQTRTRIPPREQHHHPQAQSDRPRR